jgi:hypothetical protein
MSLASSADAETSGSAGMTLAVTFLMPPSLKKAQLAMEALKIMFHLPHTSHTWRGYESLNGNLRLVLLTHVSKSLRDP